MLTQGTNGAVQKNGFSSINQDNGTDGRTPTKRQMMNDGNKGSQGDMIQGKNGPSNGDNPSNKKRTLNEMLQQQGPGMERNGALDHLQMQNFGMGSGAGDNNEGAQIE